MSIVTALSKGIPQGRRRLDREGAVWTAWWAEKCHCEMSCFNMYGFRAPPRYSLQRRCRERFSGECLTPLVLTPQGLVAERPPWRSSQSCVTGGQQHIGEIPTDSCHFFPCSTPIVTPGEGSFSYQGVSTRGVRHSPDFGGICYVYISWTMVRCMQREGNGPPKCQCRLGYRSRGLPDNPRVKTRYWTLRE